MNLRWIFILLILLNFFNYSWTYYIGAGIGDVTGPAAEINMMGYANPAQKTGGIHMRLFSRAFIITDDSMQNRVVFVSVDMGMIPQIVKTNVSKVIKDKYKNLYNETNIVLSATHTHSGPGGYHQYLLFAITSLGFVQQSFDASVAGIIRSIDIAHSRLQKGNILITKGDLGHSNINRSPTSYLQNPAQERAKYHGDVDTEMTLLRLVSLKGEEIGMINWFAVHGTCMNNTNSYISSDNKGYAAQLFERFKNPKSLAGKGPFVAAFAQMNEGDVSPNTGGPHCIDTGKPCDTYTSTCNGKTENCIAFGPGRDMIESTKIIGTNQFKEAMNLYNSAGSLLRGPVAFKHQFVDMTNITLKLPSGKTGKTCKPAMGYSFAAGTTDGPGAFDFTQGKTSSNPLWNIVRDLLHDPSKEQIECHKPKPILLDTGEMKLPYKWQPDIVETQIVQVGQLVIVAVPGEFTTMSGRRIRAGVQAAMGPNYHVVIAGLSNTYSDYIATYEEYQKQRYEAASTIYGPHTLEAYIQQFNYLGKALVMNTTVAPGPSPPYYVDKLYEFAPKVVMDRAGFGHNFGDVLVQPNSSYKLGETVQVTFISAHPRNDMKLEDTFLTVEFYNVTTRSWQVSYTDNYFETKFRWYRPGRLAEIEGRSQADISWDISANDPPGHYRIRHKGVSKSLFGSLTPFEGTTKPFIVVAGPRASRNE